MWVKYTVASPNPFNPPTDAIKGSLRYPTTWQIELLAGRQSCERRGRVEDRNQIGAAVGMDLLGFVKTILQRRTTQ